MLYGHILERQSTVTGVSSARLGVFFGLACSDFGEGAISDSTHTTILGVSQYELLGLDDPEPWDRQIAETAEEYLAFVTYRNMGPKRTQAQTARELTLSAGHVSRLAADHSWNERAMAWDFYQEKIFQAELAEYSRQMARRQLELVDRSMRALRAPIDALLTRLETEPEVTMQEFSLTDLNRLMKMVQDSSKIIPGLMAAERLATNQPTNITEHTENQNLNYGDAERIGEVLDVLRSTGVLASILGEGATGEIVDAEAVEVDDGEANSQADSLPSSAA